MRDLIKLLTIVADILFVCILLAFFLVLVISPFEKYRCESRWNDFENTYSISKGCMVKIDGKWIPTKNIRKDI